MEPKVRYGYEIEMPDGARLFGTFNSLLFPISRLTLDYENMAQYQGLNSHNMALP